MKDRNSTRCCNSPIPRNRFLQLRSLSPLAMGRPEVLRGDKSEDLPIITKTVSVPSGIMAGDKTVVSFSDLSKVNTFRAPSLFCNFRSLGTH